MIVGFKDVVSCFYYLMISFAKCTMILFRTRIPTTTTSITSPPQITTTTTTTSPPILIVSTSSYVRTTSRPKQIHVSIPPVRRPPLAPENLPDTETGRSSSPHFQHPKQFVGPVDRRNKENNNPPPR